MPTHSSSYVLQTVPNLNDTNPSLMPFVVTAEATKKVWSALFFLSCLLHLEDFFKHIFWHFEDIGGGIGKPEYSLTKTDNVLIQFCYAPVKHQPFLGWLHWKCIGLNTCLLTASELLLHKVSQPCEAALHEVEAISTMPMQLFPLLSERGCPTETLRHNLSLVAFLEDAQCLL